MSSIIEISNCIATTISNCHFKEVKTAVSISNSKIIHVFDNHFENTEIGIELSQVVDFFARDNIETVLPKKSFTFSKVSQAISKIINSK